MSFYNWLQRLVVTRVLGWTQLNSQESNTLIEYGLYGTNNPLPVGDSDNWVFSEISYCLLSPLWWAGKDFFGQVSYNKEIEMTGLLFVWLSLKYFIPLHRKTVFWDIDKKILWLFLLMGKNIELILHILFVLMWLWLRKIYISCVNFKRILLSASANRLHTL